MASDKEVYQAMTTGIKFSGAKKERTEDSKKVKTKARIKSYKTGAHKWNNQTYLHAHHCF